MTMADDGDDYKWWCLAVHICIVENEKKTVVVIVVIGVARSLSEF